MVQKKETLQEGQDGILLNVKVIPNASQFKIMGVNPWTGRLKIKVTSPAQQGKANKELLKKLQEIVDTEVRLIHGKTSQKKLILLTNRSKKEVKNALQISN